MAFVAVSNQLLVMSRDAFRPGPWQQLFRALRMFIHRQTLDTWNMRVGWWVLHLLSLQGRQMKMMLQASDFYLEKSGMFASSSKIRGGFCLGSGVEFSPSLSCDN